MKSADAWAIDIEWVDGTGLLQVEGRPRGLSTVFTDAHEHLFVCPSVSVSVQRLSCQEVSPIFRQPHLTLPQEEQLPHAGL